MVGTLLRPVHLLLTSLYTFIRVDKNVRITRVQIGDITNHQSNVISSDALSNINAMQIKAEIPTKRLSGDVFFDIFFLLSTG